MTKKRILAWVLTLLMLMNFMPMNVLAEGQADAAPSTEVSNSLPTSKVNEVSFSDAEGNQVAEPVEVTDGEPLGAAMPEGKWQDENGNDVNAATPILRAMDLRAAGDEAEKITVKFDPTIDDPLAPIEVEVVSGEAIGDQLPAVPEVPGYNTKWVVGDTEITAETVVTEPFTAVVGKEKIVYTVTFVQEDGTTTTKTTDIDDGFAINDVPEIAEKTNCVGKWVYEGTTREFTVGTVISEDLTVEASYEQNIFTVKFMVDGAPYEEMTTATGTTIVLPSDPVKAGNTFTGWFTEPNGQGTQYTATSTVNEDLTLYAAFDQQVTVHFLVKDDDGTVIKDKSQYFIDLSVGDQITTMPEEPFIEGKVFDHWKNEKNGDTVENGYTVTESFDAVAVFKTIDEYELTVNYFYKNDNGERVDIGTQVYHLVEGDLPYTVTAPGYTIASEVTDEPTYYPSQPTITASKDQFENGKLTIEDEYVAADASYKVGHYLKDCQQGRRKEYQGDARYQQLCLCGLSSPR